MRLKFKTTVEDITGDTVITTWRDYKVGQNLVGVQVDFKRPIAVELFKEDLDYIKENPNYLDHIYNSLRPY